MWIIDLADVDDYPNSVGIRIMNDHIRRAILDNVASYSGITALFHDVKITGYISSDILSNQLGVDVAELCIKDGCEWKYIDVKNSFEISDGEVKSEFDWHDLFK